MNVRTVQRRLGLSRVVFKVPIEEKNQIITDVHEIIDKSAASTSNTSSLHTPTGDQRNAEKNETSPKRFYYYCQEDNDSIDQVKRRRMGLSRRTQQKVFKSPLKDATNIT